MCIFYNFLYIRCTENKPFVNIDPQATEAASLRQQLHDEQAKNHKLAVDLERLLIKEKLGNSINVLVKYFEKSFGDVSTFLDLVHLLIFHFLNREAI